MFICDGESITLKPQLPVELPAQQPIIIEPEISNMSPKNLIMGILLGSALAAGIFVATRVTTPAEPQYAFVLPEPTALPDFSLLDQSGEPVSADTFVGRWDLVFFGFTNCPDICPTTLQTLASARAELVAAEAETLPRIVLVSVDPERDTPELLGQYVTSRKSESWQTAWVSTSKKHRTKMAITVLITQQPFSSSIRTESFQRYSVHRTSLPITCTTCRSLWVTNNALRRSARVPVPRGLWR